MPDEIQSITLEDAGVYQLQIFYGCIYFSNKTFVVNFYTEMPDKILSRMLISITLENASVRRN